MGFPGDSGGKESPCNTGDAGLIPGSRRSPGKKHDYPLQRSCLEDPMDRGAWRAAVHGATESQTRWRDFHTHTHTHIKQVLLNNTGSSAPYFVIIYKENESEKSIYLSVYKTESFCCMPETNTTFQINCILI